MSKSTSYLLLFSFFSSMMFGQGLQLTSTEEFREYTAIVPDALGYTGYLPENIQWPNMHQRPEPKRVAPVLVLQPLIVPTA